MKTDFLFFSADYADLHRFFRDSLQSTPWHAGAFKRRRLNHQLLRDADVFWLGEKAESFFASVKNCSASRPTPLAFMPTLLLL
jgi:hypothetical protein